VGSLNSILARRPAAGGAPSLDSTGWYEIFRFKGSIKKKGFMSFSLTLDIIWFLVRLLFFFGIVIAVVHTAYLIWPKKKDSDDRSEDIK
jgi:hypothetical protein